jgi:DNA-binding NarL/FixJ family response regulator
MGAAGNHQPIERMKILIVDDHEMVRKGLRSLLEEQPDLEVVAEARNGREAVTKAREHKPDVVVMDFTMPELNGREATRQIRKELPETEVLILTMHESEELAREIVADGAKGYVLKSQAGNALVEAIRSIAQHKPYFTTRLETFVYKGYLNQTTRESPTLTPREREIVQLIAEGKSNKEVAIALDISTKTAETHRTNIMRKLDLHSAGDLVRYAIRNRLVEP